MEQSAYLMTWLGKAVQIAGPFSEKAASECGREWQAENGDNPCWQVLAGAEALSVSVVSPDQVLTGFSVAAR